MERILRVTTWLIIATLALTLGGVLVYGGPVGVAVLLALNVAHVPPKSLLQTQKLCALLVLVQVVPFSIFVMRQLELSSNGLGSIAGLCVFGSVFAAPLFANAFMLVKTWCNPRVMHTNPVTPFSSESLDE